MKTTKILLALMSAAILAGCTTVDTASRNSAYDQGMAVPTMTAAQSVRVTDIKVDVPKSLEVSELNSYYPPGDIVWRGDPPGNRYQQVQAIFADGLTRGTADLNGEVPVVLDVTVERFHALTEKTRYTVGGIHSIRFRLAVRDARTGELVREPSVIKADLKGFGGQRAIEADQKGQTQKVRITDHLSRVIATELRAPGSYESRGFGFLAFAQ